MNVFFQKPLTIIILAFKLGIWNIGRYVRYHLALKFGTLKFESIGANGAMDTFYAPTLLSIGHSPVNARLFGWKEITFYDPPNWHCSPFSPGQCTAHLFPWSQAMQLLPKDVDVKEVWELSRFYWVPKLAQEVRSGNAAAGVTLNLWLRDWVSKNPPYLGINWSCAQEAAIRILHCAQAAFILGEVQSPQPALIRLITNNAARIEPTLHYALAQQNNHGSAEAAGLFVAGSWLELLGVDPRAKRWKELGRRWLENRAKVLILKDGSSNQYSTNYHRVVLDTYNFVEIWRRQINDKCFSKRLIAQLREASRWLYEMTDKNTGYAPNFGANDGSFLLSGSSENYNDFRPTVQLATVLFDGSLAYLSRDSDQLLELYGIERPQSKLPEQQSKIYDQGGYMLLRNKNASAIMRFPKYTFRPSHCDALHLDLSVNGKPIFFDAGTFSYTKTDEIDLSQVTSHNTVQFDQRDQMRKLTRFLYADWLSSDAINGPYQIDDYIYGHAAYKDRHSCQHARTIILKDDLLIVKDLISGFVDNAVLRWNFLEGADVLENLTIIHNGKIIDLQNHHFNQYVNLKNTFYATHYLKTENCLNLEIKIQTPGEIITQLKF